MSICRKLWPNLNDRMYNYHDTAIRAERLARGTDHCESGGIVFALATLVNDSGLVVDPREKDGQLLDTQTKEIVIFAINEKLVVHIGFDGDRGAVDAVKHETLFHNANLRAAGEVEFRNGTVVGINDHSGSYGTYGMLRSDPRFLEAVVSGFKKTNVRMRSLLTNSLKLLERR